MQSQLFPVEIDMILGYIVFPADARSGTTFHFVHHLLYLTSYTVGCRKIVPVYFHIDRRLGSHTSRSTTGKDFKGLYLDIFL